MGFFVPFNGLLFLAGLTDGEPMTVLTGDLTGDVTGSPGGVTPDLKNADPSALAIAPHFGHLPRSFASWLLHEGHCPGNLPKLEFDLAIFFPP